MQQGSAERAIERPGTAALFAAFLTIALSGFGGVLPFARRTLVDRRGWLTDADFNETLALCQSLPGPNVVNLSIVVGSRFAGPAGAAAALVGLIGAPILFVLAAGALWSRFSDVAWLARSIAALGAAAAGLVAATAMRMAAPLLKARPLAAAPVVLLAFAGAGLARFPLIWVIAVLGPASVAIAWAQRR
ncbi:MAG TPA: chromate transporter [Caulobacteraceae bacterium]|nr:chromate transporter [Caulobacteraceae bacterium]